jgi:hypothetical protein
MRFVQIQSVFSVTSGLILRPPTLSAFLFENAERMGHCGSLHNQ